METDRPIALVINSYDKLEPAVMEDPDTWCDSVMLYLQTPEGNMYAKKLSKNQIIEKKREEATKGKIELISSFLERNYGKIYCLPLGYTISIEDKNDEMSK